MPEVKDAPKRKPGRPPKTDKPAKKLGVYRIYKTDKTGALVFIEAHPAKNAEHAVSIHLQNAKPTGVPYVVVPQRNITEVNVEVENVTKVRFTSA